MGGAKLRGLSWGKNWKESFKIPANPMLLTHGQQVAIWCGINIRWWQITLTFCQKQRRDSDPATWQRWVPAFGDKELESDSMLHYVNFHPSQRYLKKNHRTQNTQHSKLGDRTRRLSHRQVRGGTEDREPGSQNSRSHLILRIPFSTILTLHNSEAHLWILCLKIIKPKRVGRVSVWSGDLNHKHDHQRVKT